MNLEQMPFRVLVKWLLFAVLLLFALTLLGMGNMWGLMPVVGGFVHLYLFRPPKPLLTDADIDALLGRA